MCRVRSSSRRRYSNSSSERLTRKSKWGSEKVDPAELWGRYQRDKSDAVRNELVEHYLPIVRYTAERMAATLPQSVELDDLISAGLFGLIEAIKSFDLDRGVKFKTYASWRVRGAILDDLRANDWVPRLVRTKATQLEKMLIEAEAELGRPATDLELASMMGMSIKELRDLMHEANATSVCSLNEAATDNQDASSRADLVEDTRVEDPTLDLQRKDVMEAITRELNLRERMIVMLYYSDELTMKEIGLTLGLSESRVCQLHTRIMSRLRARLGRRADELAVT